MAFQHLIAHLFIMNRLPPESVCIRGYCWVVNVCVWYIIFILIIKKNETMAVFSSRFFFGLFIAWVLFGLLYYENQKKNGFSGIMFTSFSPPTLFDIIILLGGSLMQIKYVIIVSETKYWLVQMLHTHKNMSHKNFVNINWFFLNGPVDDLHFFLCL